MVLKCGITPELIISEINSLKSSQDKLIDKKENILKNISNEFIIERQDIADYFYNFQKLFLSSDLNEKKELIQTFISNITLNKKEHQIEITPYSIGVRNIGAGSGNRTRVISLEG